jgi:hypothetical protein
MFLRALFPEQEGDERIEVRAIRRDGSVARCFARSIEEAVNYARRWRKTAHVYFGLALRDGEYGDAEHLARLWVLWADVDDKAFPDGAAGALAAIERFPLRPSIVLRTGHGYLAIWRLREAHDLTDEHRLRRVLEGIRLDLSTDSSIPLDRVGDLARMARLVSTYNWKDPWAHEGGGSLPPLPVTVEHFEPDRQYDLGNFVDQGIWSDLPSVNGHHPDAKGHRAEPIPEQIKEGRRHQILTSLAGSLSHRGLPASVIATTLRAINEAQCAPSLPKEEVQAIADWAASRAAGDDSNPSPPLYKGGTESNRTTADARWKAIPLSELAPEGADVDWTWDGYIGRGQITLFSARAKLGKSTLLRHLLKSGTTGQSFCGQSTHLGRTLVISEEAAVQWARYRDDLNLPDSISAVIRPFLHKPSRRDWETFITHATALVQREGFDLVIFDSLAALWPVLDENSATDVQVALLPLLSVVEAGAAAVLVHHNGKGPAAEGAGARGSTALPAFADIILELRAFEVEGADPRRLLSARGRFGDETRGQVVITYEAEKGFTVLGNKTAVRTKDRLAHVIDLLPTGAPGLTVEELLEGWPDGERRPGKRDLRAALSAGVEDGIVRRTGEGVKGNPHRFVAIGESDMGGGAA